MQVFDAFWQLHCFIVLFYFSHFFCEAVYVLTTAYTLLVT